jgi:hypothetical protein
VLFNTTPTSSIPDTPDEEAIGVYLRGAYAAFARDPINGLNTYGWPQYSTTDSTLIRLAYKNRTGPNLAIGNMYDIDCVGIPNVESPQNIDGTMVAGIETTATAGGGSTEPPLDLDSLGSKIELRAGMPMIVFILTAYVSYW